MKELSISLITNYKIVFLKTDLNNKYYCALISSSYSLSSKMCYIALFSRIQTVF